MMTRTQISLPPEDYERAKAKAAEMDVSIAEYFRQLVARDLGQEDRSSAMAVRELFDSGDSGGSDIAADKHAYIGESLTRKLAPQARGQNTGP